MNFADEVKFKDFSYGESENLSQEVYLIKKNFLFQWIFHFMKRTKINLKILSKEFYHFVNGKYCIFQ